MTDPNYDNLDLKARLQAVQQSITDDSPTTQTLPEATTALSQIADVAAQTDQWELSRGATLLARVLELAVCWESQPESKLMVQQLVGFFHEFVPELKTVAESGSDDHGRVDAFINLAEEKWSDYLELLDDRDAHPDDWSPIPDEIEDVTAWEHDSDEPEGVSNEQIELLLSAVADSAATVDEHECPAANPDTQFPADTVKDFELDLELLEAYLDDANRCLSSMEQAALAKESSPEDTDAIPQFCRELHTLKGASATVGLSELASYLHELETSLNELFANEATEANVEPLFEAVDRVRAEIANLAPTQSTRASSDPTKSANVTSVDTGTATNELAPFSINDNSSIRIRASQIDRLMDMLAELVVLRNRRESNVGEFNALNKELAACASRLNLVNKQQGLDIGNEVQPAAFEFRSGSNTLSEVTEDIAVVFEGLRDLQKPVSQDNTAISRFIRDFRQELMQLRRIPVSGLFNRLQRAVRDAAKQENKQVQVKLVGHDAGLEQEIQERLFESLLHIVRNAVSHGIESEPERAKNGKNPVGTVTLEASSNAQLLVIEVRDDGNGINYEGVRKRAIEKGLLAANQFPSNTELADLIFHPGFSTREHASEVSGRGVGMNIVANTIHQLHGRVEVDSVSGQGSTIRLLIPLRTGIEHVMVFRCDGQLFALPMESVTAAKKTNATIGNIARLTLSSASSPAGTEPKSENVLMLKSPNELGNSNHNSVEQKTQVALAVDELIGPEEVVVRGLPNLLKRHPLFCGVTLSGSGESVLLLNADRVVQFCDQPTSLDDQSRYDNLSDQADSKNRKRALVVDDSLTARRVLVKFLQKQGFTTAEAGDGMEAIEILHRESFDLVLTDLDMPRLGGLELLADIQSGRFCEAPVAVVSSRNEETFRSRALDLGATEYVTKPVSETSITQLLESLKLFPEHQKV